MSIIESFKICIFHKYADFKGTANRSEYWWFWSIYVFMLFGIPLIGFLVEDLYKIQLYLLMFLWGIGIIGLTCPFIAVSARRLHDSGLNGWHFFWRLIPYVGSVITLVLMLRKSKVPYSKK